MNAALNGDVGRLKSDIEELRQNNRKLDQINIKLNIKLKDIEILLIKYEEEIQSLRQ